MPRGRGGRPPRRQPRRRHLVNRSSGRARDGSERSSASTRQRNGSRSRDDAGAQLTPHDCERQAVPRAQVAPRSDDRRAAGIGGLLRKPEVAANSNSPREAATLPNVDRTLAPTADHATSDPRGEPACSDRRCVLPRAVMARDRYCRGRARPKDNPARVHGPESKTERTGGSPG